MTALLPTTLPTALPTGQTDDVPGRFARDPEVETVGLSRELYDVLVEQGWFEGQHVELLEGELVHVPPQGWPHSRGVDVVARGLDRALRSQHGDGFLVRQEKPVAATDDSEPEPDVSVVDGTALDGDGHPSQAYLVVEVAESSIRIDLDHKPRVYAAAGIPQYWVVDLRRRRVVVHRDPQAGGEPGYARVEALPLHAPLDVLGVRVTLSDLLGDR